jgi:hypothetical protein
MSQIKFASNNLSVYGDTLTANDPIITIGGNQALVFNDNKDRGIEFRWHDGTNPKLGFFGFDASSQQFTYIPDASNSGEVISGAVGSINAHISFSNILATPTTLAGYGITDALPKNNPIFTGLLSGPSATFDSMRFNQAATVTPAVGQLSWNATDGTLDLGLIGGNVTLQIGQEQVALVLNKTGVDLVNGKVVRVTGSQGQRTTVALAQSDTLSNATNVIGVLTEDILNNQQGFVTTGGLIHDLDTSAFTENDVLWLSASVPGGITNVKPAAPHKSIRIGYCVRSHAVVGQIRVELQIGTLVSELDDISFTSLANGQLLSYNSTTQTWNNVSTSSVLAGVNTDNLPEGVTNLYFTNARARNAISVSGSLAYNSSTGVISFTDAVTSVAGRTGVITLTSSDVGLGNVNNTSDLNKPISTATQTALDGKVSSTLLGAVNGVATLDASGLVPATQLPSYVDDVLEFAALASFPATGSTGKIYVALDSNKTYRWSGSAYIEISASPGSTDAVTEGVTNLYFTNTRARNAISVSGSLAYNSTTGVISFTDAVTSVSGRTGVITLTSSDVGLGNVDNTSDVNKPISTATQTALNLKLNASAPAYTGGITGTGVVNLDSNQFVKDANGHIGLGIIPHTSWNAAAKVIDFQSRGSIGAGTNGAVGDLFLATNAYTTGNDPGTATWNYRAAGLATKIESYNGVITLDTAVTGALDGAISWARGITVNATGVGVKTTSVTEALQIGDGTAGLTKFYQRLFGSSTGADLYIGQSSGTIFGHTAGTIGVVYQNASAPLGIVAAGAGQDLLFGAGGSSTIRAKISGTDGSLSVTSTTASTTTTTGAVIISGGVGIAGNVNIGGTLSATGGLPLSNVRDDNGTALYDDSVKNNLMEAPRWGSSLDGWNPYGIQGTNSTAYTVMPNGEYSVVWQGDSIIGNLNWFAGPYSKLVKVYPDRTYRFIMPIRRTSANTDGHVIYIGATAVANVVDTLNTSTTNSNAYFLAVNIANLIQNKWYLLVGHIYPTGVTGFTNQAKLIDMDTGDNAAPGVVSTLTDFNWNAAVTQFRMRSGLHKPTAATQICTAQWGKPKFEVMDGSESDYTKLFASPSGIGNALGLVGTNVTINGNKIRKTGGVNSTWDAGAYSTVGYAGGSFVRFRIANLSTAYMVGLNTDPATDSNYTGIDYAVYINSASFSVYESGTAYSNLTTVAVGDIISITYDGVNVKYYKNGTIVRTVAATVTASLYFDSSIFTLSSGTIEDVEFGPLVSTNWADVGNKPTTISGYGITDAVNTADSFNLGTTSITLNRASGAQSLTGISIDGSAATVTGAAQTAITSLGTLTGLTSSGVVNITNATASTNTTTGALTVAGGVGIAGDLFAGTYNTANSTASALTASLTRFQGDTNFRLNIRNGAGTAVSTEAARIGLEYSGSLNAGISFFRGAGTTGGYLTFSTNNGTTYATLTAAGQLSLAATTASTSATTGALVVAGGVGVSDAIVATNGYASISAATTTIFTPGGAKYSNAAANLRGAFVITLPQSWTTTMMDMHIRVFLYAAGQGFDLYCSGYNYQPSTQWFNTSARIVGQPDVTQNYKVRFGHDGTKCVIVIGDENATTGSLWQYPRVEVVRWSGAQSTFGVASWNTGWAISLVNDLTTYTFTSTLTNTQVNTVTASLGSNIAASTGRNSPAAGVYTQNTTNASLGDTTPVAYWATLGFGRGTGGSIEIAGSWHTSNSLWYRGLRDTTDNWTAWKEILTSASYNTYSPTLTGTGASGTWSISVTGSAATVTGAAQTAITSLGTLTGLTSSGAVSITDTTASTSTTTGALVVSGGIGSGGNAFINGTLTTGGNVYFGSVTGSSTYRLHVETPGIAGVALAQRISSSGNGGSGRGTGFVIAAPGSASAVEVVRIDGLQETASATANNASYVVNVANTSGTLTERHRINAAGDIIFGNGDSVASASATIIRGSNTSTNDTAGVNLTIRPGLGKGTGNSGAVVIQAGVTAGSGATANTVVDRVTVNSAGIATTGAITNDTSITAPVVTVAGRSSVKNSVASLFSLPAQEASLSFAAATYETTKITCVADVAGSLAGTYFRLYGPQGTAGAINPSGVEQIIDVWFQVSGAGTQPASGAGRYVLASITTGATAIQVAAAIQTALTGDTAFSSTGVDGAGSITVVSSMPNDFTNSSAGTSGFTVTTIRSGSGAITGSSKYTGGVLAPNGKIYMIPYGSVPFRSFDPDTGVTVSIGAAQGASAYVGGVLGQNGKIYAIPSFVGTVAELDPATNVITQFGSLGATGSIKWWGGVLAPNGKIYCAPGSSGNILVIDPATQTTYTIGSGLSSYQTGALALNGKIYFAPASATTVLVVDPSTDTYTTIGTLSATATKYMGCALAPNGKIYAVPYSATDFLVIDPVAGTATTKGSLAGTAKWCGAVLAPNGKIYGLPRTSTSVLVIDPNTDTASTFGSLGTADKYIGGVLAPNGNIYGIPFSATAILEIGGGASDFPDWYLSAYFNKL